MSRRVDVLMARWFEELRSTWRSAAETVARAAKRVEPACRVYVIGSVAEGTYTAVSDLDILVVLPRDAPPREKRRVKTRILLEAFDSGSSSTTP